MNEMRESEIGEIPKTWEVGILEDLAEIIDPHPSHRAPEVYDGGIPFAGIGDISESGAISFDKARKVNPKVAEEHKERYTINKYSIGYGRVGTVGKVVKLKPQPYTYTLSPTLAVINPKNGCNPQFVYSIVRDPTFFQRVLQDMTGSTRPAIGIQKLRKILVPLPPLEEQNEIAEVLSSLDDKIDLLHRQNHTLEKMAETLFRQWFVEEADDNWEVVQLQDIAEVKNGFAFSSKSYVDFSPEHLEVLKMGHIEKGGGLRTDPKRDYAPREERLDRYILDKGDIVMAMTDMKDNVVILGVPAMIDESDRYILNQRVARIYLKNRDSLISEYLLYIQLKDPDFIAELQSKANSGVQVNLSTVSIKESAIFIPPIELQLKKGNSITDLYLKKEYNDKQIKNLTKLRDTLLPKLISGEVSIADRINQ
jgi:type I restriction enzyme S subunit